MVNWENTFHEIAQAKAEIGILPIGAIEQHSYHLPVATDWLIAQELSRRVAQDLGNCYLLPALPFSCSREHSDFAGSIWIRPATLAAIIEDIVRALHHQGIEKVVVLVAHGGNWVVKPTVREINLDRNGVKVILPSLEGGGGGGAAAGEGGGGGGPPAEGARGPRPEGGGGCRNFSVGTASGGCLRARICSVGGSGGAVGGCGGRSGRWIRCVGGS